MRGQKIAELRKQRGITQIQLAKSLHVTPGAVSQWEHDTTSPQTDSIVMMAKIFGVDISDLMAEEPQMGEKFTLLSSIPVVGKIACGKPIEAIETYDERIQVPHGSKADFALLCAGDSMEPYIQDGDYVLIRKQPDVENGKVAAVKIEGEATLKRVYHIPDGLLLVAENHSYAPITAQYIDVQIIGLAVGLHRNFK